MMVTTRNQTVYRFLLEKQYILHDRKLMLKSISSTRLKAGLLKQKGIEQVQALADISRSCYVVIATKPAHQLQ